MSVIRTLHETDTGQEREEQKKKLELKFKQCDTHLDRLAAHHQGDFSSVMQTFSTLSGRQGQRQVVDSSRKSGCFLRTFSLQKR